MGTERLPELLSGVFQANAAASPDSAALPG
jgi:hypothetical protein